MTSARLSGGEMSKGIWRDQKRSGENTQVGFRIKVGKIIHNVK
jgi:hypothetical protein